MIAAIFWIMWGLTIVGLLVVGRRHHRETRRTWIGTGKIGGVQTTIRARFTDPEPQTPPEIAGITWRRP